MNHGNQIEAQFNMRISPCAESDTSVFSIVSSSRVYTDGRGDGEESTGWDSDVPIFPTRKEECSQIICFKFDRRYQKGVWLSQTTFLYSKQQCS